MNIREAKQEDIIQLVLLFDGYRVFYRKESDVDQATIFLNKRLQEKDSQIFICENKEGTLTGFVQLYPLFSSIRMKKLWLLNDLFVDPKYRGNGISKMLIERSKQLVKETSACGMFLETEKSNTIGNNLYPDTGFVLNSGSNFYEWNVE